MSITSSNLLIEEQSGARSPQLGYQSCALLEVKEDRVCLAIRSDADAYRPGDLPRSVRDERDGEDDSTLGQDAYVFGSANGIHQPTIQAAWETLRLLANGIAPKTGKEGAEWNQFRA
jgi:hypothetical protein